jgi:hypothetical protein
MVDWILHSPLHEDWDNEGFLSVKLFRKLELDLFIYLFQSSQPYM